MPGSTPHLVLGTAKLLQEAGLLPHGKVTSQREWEELTKREEEFTKQDGRVVIEITESYVEEALSHKLNSPYDYDQLCVFSYFTYAYGFGIELQVDFMSMEKYFEQYWK